MGGATTSSIASVLFGWGDFVFLVGTSLPVMHSMFDSHCKEGATAGSVESMTASLMLTWVTYRGALLGTICWSSRR